MKNKEVVKMMAEEIIPTSIMIELADVIIEVIKIKLLSERVNGLEPGLFVYLFDEAQQEVRSQNLQILTYNDNLIAHSVNFALDEAGRKGDMMLAFSFGCLVILNSEEKGDEVGFLARVISVDGRQLAMFLPMNLQDDGYFSISGEKEIIDTTDHVYKEDMLNQARISYIESYRKHGNPIKEDETQT